MAGAGCLYPLITAFFSNQDCIFSVFSPCSLALAGCYYAVLCPIQESNLFIDIDTGVGVVSLAASQGCAYTRERVYEQVLTQRIKVTLSVLVIFRHTRSLSSNFTLSPSPFRHKCRQDHHRSLCSRWRVTVTEMLCPSVFS